MRTITSIVNTKAICIQNAKKSTKKYEVIVGLRGKQVFNSSLLREENQLSRPMK